jgi:hypothetical protein
MGEHKEAQPTLTQPTSTVSKDTSTRDCSRAFAQIGRRSRPRATGGEDDCSFISSVRPPRANGRVVASLAPRL